jgi:hypothetical protein
MPIGSHSFKTACALFSFAVLAHSQPLPGTFQVSLTPKEISPGDSTWFQAGIFSPGLCPFHASYAVSPLGGEIDTYLVTVFADSTGGKCASAFGFSGPQFHIVGAQPGRYVIRFDAASPFQADMRDTAVFFVRAGTGIKRAAPAGTLAGRDSRIWRINGQRLRYGPPARREF